MSSFFRLSITLLSVAALGFANMTARALGDKEVNPREPLLKIADAIAKKDMDGAKSQAAALAKDVEVDNVMDLLRPRKYKGFGMGAKGTIEPDGIDAKFRAIKKDDKKHDAQLAKELEKHADDFVKAGYITAAVAEVAKNKPPKGISAGDKAKWDKYAEEMQKAALDFAETAKTKNVDSVKKSTTALVANCKKCHDDFKSKE